MGSEIRYLGVAVAAILLLATAAWLLIAAAAWLLTAATSPDLVPGDAIHHRVHHGETLWDIAACLNQPGDVRNVVAIIRDANDGAATFAAGDVLYIPSTVAGGEHCRPLG